MKNAGETGIAAWIALVARMGLDHRISISGSTYGGNRGDDWAFFDTYFGPQL
jgi:hypothetical protein